MEYIEKNNNEYLYTNNEEVLIHIFNSNISEEYKLKYAENNEIQIMNLSVVKDIIINDKLMNCLFARNNVEFTSENISVYFDVTRNYSKEFIEYIERNLNDNNLTDILSDNKLLCNSLINNPVISHKMFNIVIDYADEKIEKINFDLSQNRINILLKRKLITVNIDNIELLMNHSYFNKCLLGRLLIPRAMRVDKRALALGDIV